MAQLLGGPRRTLSIFFAGQRFPVTRKKIDFPRNFEIRFPVSGPRYSCPNFFSDGPWASPYNELKNLAPTPDNFAKMGCKFFGGGAISITWGQYCRGRLKPVRVFTRGPSGVQNKIIIEPLGLTVWSPEPREKVTILKFWPVGPIWGRCSPRYDPQVEYLFAIDTLGVKVSGNMKNGPRSLFSFRDMKAQTSMRSRSRKMSQKSAKSKNAHFPRKFITD